LLLGGQKSPASITTELFHSLQDVIADSSVELLSGLDHNAPDEKAPQVVGERLSRFLVSQIDQDPQSCPNDDR
jgi:hypothetical protein